MKISSLLVPSALVATATAAAWDTPNNATGIVWTTVITTGYTTYCPSPTTFVHKNVTYTATRETTLTITNCPCTVTFSRPPVTPTHPVSGPPVPPPSSFVTSLPPPSTGKPAPPPPPGSHQPAPPVSTHIGNTVVIPPPVPSAPTSTGIITVPNAATKKNAAGFGAIVAAGFAALLL